MSMPAVTSRWSLHGASGPGRDDPCAGVAILGSPSARLLSGPTVDDGPETLEAHLVRLGPLRPAHRAEVLDLVDASGLQGRGGGEFPVARKLAVAAAAGGPALVVANGSESEPASRKDRLLLEHRPHLVLDGLALIAAAVAATEGAVYLHAGRARTRAVLTRAIAERRAAGLEPRTVDLVVAPERFVAGESSAVVSFLETRDARPRRSPAPAAVRGVHGRPTVVSNVETLAHLGLLARGGAGWFRGAGSSEAPGSSLVTLGGAAASPGEVVEVLRPVSLGTLLQAAAGLEAPPAGVLFGGYGGTWVSGNAGWAAPLDRAALRRAGVALGCGLVAPLGHGACGLALTARLCDYLAQESAGQCGACVRGLPALAGALGALARGAAGRGELRRLLTAARAIRGAGGCAHPDGAVGLIESALGVFAGDADRHARGRPCPGADDPGLAGWFPTARSAPGGVR